MPVAGTSRSSALYLAAIVLTGLSTVSARAAKPVALVGASYGRHEVGSIVRNVLSRSRDDQYVYEDVGDAFPTADLLRFDLIVVAHSVRSPLTLEASQAVAAYLEGGGHLLLINSAPRSLAADLGFPAMEWAGMERVSWHRAGLPCEVLQTDHPWLAGVFDGRTNAPAWQTGGILARVAPDGMRTIIGTEAGDCLCGVREVGQGWVAYLGHELFRLRKAGSTTRPDSPSWIRLVGNIVAAARPLRQSDVREAAFVAAAATGADLLVWDREWQKGESFGPRFDPPLPAEAEVITSLSADMAVDEYESLQLNLTPVTELGNARCHFDTGAFPRDHVELLVQDRPDPIPWKKNPAIAKEFPYWLMPPEYVAPKGDMDFTVPARETRILWIRLNSFGVSPGTYRPVLHVEFGTGKRIALPIALTVYPVRLPRRRIIKLMPGGTVYGDVNNAEPAIRFMQDLEAHGFEWSIYNAIRPWKCGIRGEAGVLDAGYIRANHAAFLAGDYPALTFAAFDEWVTQSIAHNQTSVRAHDVAHYLHGLLAKAGIEGDAQRPVELWFAREFSRYLREKGVACMITSIGDELSEKELIERWLPWARKMTDTGWGCASTFTGMYNTGPDLNGQLWPYVKLWTLNRGTILPFTEGLRDGRLKVRPDAIVGTYGAGEGRGTEFRKALGRSRFLGWESWMLGVQNCMPNPYFKGWLYYCDYRNKDLGIGGERFVSFVDADDPSAPLADSPFLEGIREGMEDGNLCAILSWYLERMPASPAVALVRTRLQGVLSDSPDAMLRWHEVKHHAGYRHRVIEGDNAAYRRAKHEILECLAALQAEANKTVRPSLSWNDIVLVKDGEPTAAIYTADTPVDGLTGRIEELCGVALPVVRDAVALDPRYPNAVVVGNGTQNPLTKALLAAHDEDDADEWYPGPGSYFVKTLQSPDATGGPILVVAGPDAAGTDKGIRLFGMFLQAEGAWLLEERPAE